MVHNSSVIHKLWIKSFILCITLWIYMEIKQIISKIQSYPQLRCVKHVQIQIISLEAVSYPQIEIPIVRLDSQHLLYSLPKRDLLSPSLGLKVRFVQIKGGNLAPLLVNSLQVNELNLHAPMVQCQSWPVNSPFHLQSLKNNQWFSLLRSFPS